MYKLTKHVINPQWLRNAFALLFRCVMVRSQASLFYVSGAGRD